MRSNLDELVHELDELRSFVDSITPVNKALENHQDPMVRQYVIVRRRFDDAAFAVALYASFEKFVENVVAAFARLEAGRLRYTELPPKLVKKHSFRTGELLNRGRLGEGRYVGLTELEVVKNLFECLSGVRPYTLNKAAVVAHDVNLRVSEIDQLFAAVGIEQVCERVRRADALLKWYCDVEGLETPPAAGVALTTVEERVKDLVERRNQISHHGTTQNLLGVDEMREAISFVQAFSGAVFATAVARYLEARHTDSPGSIKLVQRDEGPYKNGTVVVVEHPAQRLFVGQAVFVLVEATGARWGHVKSLMVDDVSVTEVAANASAPNGVGIELDFKCPKGSGLVALTGADDVVWSQPQVAAAPAAPAA